jgi:hypothetical protein
MYEHLDIDECTLLTNESNASMSENVSLVAASHVLVVNGLSGFGVHPTHVQGAIFEATVEVLDITHHPSHFNAALNGEVPSSLHLPPCPRAAPGTDLREACYNDHFVQVDQPS